MKICILHLSDLHLDNNVQPSILTERMQGLISSFGMFDQVKDIIIICSGDIANRGARNDYVCASLFFHNLKSGIEGAFKNKPNVYTFFVPGNHDMNYGNKEDRDSKTIQEIYKVKRHDEACMNCEQEYLTDFWEFENKRCFTQNRMINKRIIQCGSLKLRINLINSAVFSSLDNDKGLHHIPEMFIDDLYITEKEYNNGVIHAITVMHHSPEWYNDGVKQKLLNALYEGTSLLFLGHEHVVNSIDSELNACSLMKIIGGGVFADTEDKNSSSYNIAVIDTEKTDMPNILVYQYVWSHSSKIYVHKAIGKQTRLISNKPPRNDLFPMVDFINQLQLDNKRKFATSFMDYFVFPRLTEKKRDSYSVEKEIVDIEAFVCEIEEKKRVFIIGDDNSGKSTLAKFLFLYYAEKNMIYPLLFTADDINKKKISSVINQVFREQYGAYETDWIRFQQAAKSKKIAIIDDASRIKKIYLEKLIEEFETQFEFIVICAKDEVNFDIIEKAKTSLHEKEKEGCRYKICRIYSDKRRELIRKVISVSSDFSICNVDAEVKKINESIKKQIQYFQLDPDFIIQYVQFLIGNNGNPKHKQNIFSMVFENAIQNAIIACRPKDSLDRISILLEEVAYYVHFHRKYPFELTDLTQVVKTYNYEYGENIDVKNFYDVVTEARIIRSIDDSWNLKFSNKNYLAYFVARKLNRNYHEGKKDDLEKVVKNICFGINGDIVLFLSYLTQNTQILKFICDQASMYMGEWPELDFNQKNISFIFNYGSTNKAKAPDNEDKNKLVAAETEAEKSVDSSHVIEAIDIYDYDENEIELLPNRFIKALKYTELIAKSLPNFSHLLKIDEKENIINKIYSYPNKIVYSCLIQIETDFAEIVDYLESELHAFEKRTGKKHKLNKSDIAKLLAKLGTDTILGVYDYIASVSTDKNTIIALERFDCKSKENYMLQNIMMEENAGRISQFMEKLEKLNHLTKSNVVKSMLSRVVRKCLINHDDISSANERVLRSRYFDVPDQKILLTTKMKRKSEYE